jgi:hypothetical protein
VARGGLETGGVDIDGELDVCACAEDGELGFDEFVKRSCDFVGFNARFKRRPGALMSGDADVAVGVEVVPCWFDVDEMPDIPRPTGPSSSNSDNSSSPELPLPTELSSPPPSASTLIPAGIAYRLGTTARPYTSKSSSLSSSSPTPTCAPPRPIGTLLGLGRDFFRSRRRSRSCCCRPFSISNTLRRPVCRRKLVDDPPIEWPAVEWPAMDWAPVMEWPVREWSRPCPYVYACEE